MLSLMAARTDMWNKFFKMMVAVPTNQVTDLLHRVTPRYRVEIERTTSTTHDVDADSPEEAVEKAHRAYTVDSRRNLSNKAVRTHIYVKNDGDGYDLITGLREPV